MPLQLSADADEFFTTLHTLSLLHIAHEESFNTQIMHTVVC